MKLPIDPQPSQSKSGGVQSSGLTSPSANPIPSSAPQTPSNSSRTDQSASSQTSSQASESSRNTAPSQAAPSEPLSDKEKQVQLNQLRHQWAKVVSSQPLSEHQIQRLVQAEQLKGEAANLRWQLVKLDTLNGLLSVLSSQGASKGSMVMIQQSPNGQWQLNTSQHTWFQSLMHSGLSSSQASQPSSAPLRQALSVLLSTMGKAGDHASQSLTTSTTVNAELVKTQLLSSGQRFEAQLAVALKQAVTHAIKDLPNPTSAATEPKGLSPQGFTHALNTLASVLPTGGGRSNMTIPHHNHNSPSQNPVQSPLGSPQPSSSELLKQASQSLNTWIGKVREQWQHATIPQASAAQPPEHPRLPPQQAEQLRVSIGEALKSVSQADLKGALLSQQQTMVAQLGKQEWVQTLLPSVLSALSQTPGASQQVTQPAPSQAQDHGLLTLLFKPKTFTLSSGEQPHLPVWPKNLAVQPTIEKMLAQLIMQAPKDADTQQAQVALRLAQQINRIQGEQIHNRLSQDNPAQPAPTSTQLSIPYLHQNETHWAQLEWRSQGATKKEDTHVRSWHMVLRFLQDQPRAFAIECHLTHNTINVVLWSKDTPQLRQLNEYKSKLMDGLIQAGFKVENIMTKNGTPAALATPIQNSLVDVRT